MMQATSKTSNQGRYFSNWKAGGAGLSPGGESAWCGESGKSAAGPLG